MKFIISYIEDNEIGGHKKEILVVGEDFQSCYEGHIQKYPTMVGIVQQFDEEHETINFLRPNNFQIEKVTDKIFENIYNGFCKFNIKFRMLFCLVVISTSR